MTVTNAVYYTVKDRSDFCEINVTIQMKPFQWYVHLVLFVCIIFVGFLAFELHAFESERVKLRDYK